jgi:putative two-component system response regulator
MQVLVIDDDVVSLEILAADLSHFGYEVTVASDGLEGFELIRTGRFRIVVSDWQMPGMSGLELCRELRKRGAYGYVYFILLTANSGMENMVEGFRAGADDFLTKPFQPHELWMRIRTGERVLSLEGRDLIIFSMAKLAESRDNDTGVHLERMREYSRILAEELSTWPKYKDIIDGNYVQLLYLTSPLHDIGKVAIPDSVLLKPGKLTTEEFEVMKKHTVFGGDTLNSVAHAGSAGEFLMMARDIALTHHERFDGKGYPAGLQGEQIPLCGRIVALADVYDALTSKRVYKPAFTHESAKAIILDGLGTQFDPDIVEAFKRREEQFIAIHQQLNVDAAASGHGSVAIPPAGLPQLSAASALC